MRSERMKMRVTRVKETVMQSDNRQRSVNMERFTFHDYKPHRVWVWVWTENWWYTSNSFLSVHHWQLSQVYKNVNYIIFFDILLMFCTDNIDSSVQIISGAQISFFCTLSITSRVQIINSFAHILFFPWGIVLWMVFKRRMRKNCSVQMHKADPSRAIQCCNVFLQSLYHIYAVDNGKVMYVC